jgi:hypothetical protein
MGRIAVPSQNRQKSSQDPDTLVYTCHPSHGGKSKIGGLQFRLAWEKSETLSQK